MNQTLQKLHDIKKNGYQLDFGDVFNHAFENYKKIAVYAGAVLVIFTFIYFIFFGVTLVSVLGLSTIAEEFTPEKLKLGQFSSTLLFKIGCVTVFISTLFSPFLASFLKMAEHGEKDKNFPVSSLFEFYKPPYFKEIIFSTFLILTINLAQTTLMNYLKLELLGNFIYYFISFTTILTIPLIVFGNLLAFDAIKYSIILVCKQPIILLGLMIVAIIGVFVGVLGCCVGIFFTIPILYSMNYAIYDAIIGIERSEENN